MKKMKSWGLEKLYVKTSGGEVRIITFARGEKYLKDRYIRQIRA